MDQNKDGIIDKVGRPDLTTNSSWLYRINFLNAN